MTTSTFAAAADVQPTPNAVLVQNISANATEKAVKDFFSFCGKINKFELAKAGETQEAFILFDKESAANTARLLTNAVIVDRSVTVLSYFNADKASDPAAAVEADERKAAEAKDTEHKSYTTVVAELLAGGYTLTQPVVRKGIEIDAQYSLSASLFSFFNTAQAKAQALDQKYQVTEMLKANAVKIDQRLHLKERADFALAKSKEIGEQALHTPVGQKVKETVDYATAQGMTVVNETRTIIDSKSKAAAATDGTVPPTTAPPTDAPAQ
ncbi:Protein vip1 [Sorochytrium milnesiophthora]